MRKYQNIQCLSKDPQQYEKNHINFVHQQQDYHVEITISANQHPHIFQIFRQSSDHLWKTTSILLSECNWTGTYNHLVRKRILKHLAKLASLAKWLNVRLQTKWLWVRVPLQKLKLQILCLLRARFSLTFRQLESVDSL